MERRSKERAPAISLGVRVALFTSLSVLTAILLSALALEITGRWEARGAADEQLHRARNLASGRLARDGDALRRLAATVARDPKFFALLALRRSERTASYRRSLEGVIGEFQADANVEIFDITDEWGATAAASQRPAAPEPSRGGSPLVRQALAGKGGLGFRLEGGRLYRIAVVPVMAGGASAVGTLTLGSRVDETFAGAVRATTGVEVLLLAGETRAGAARPSARSIVTTLSDAAARSVLETIGPARGGESRGRVPRGKTVSLAKAPALAMDVPFDGPTEGGAARLLLIAPIALDAGLVPLREMLLLAGALAAAVSLVVGFLVGRRMSQRLRRIRMAARAVSLGDYNVRLPAVVPDEVGLLTADFGAMRETQRREIERLTEMDRMKTDFLEVTAQDLSAPVEAIRRAGEELIAKNASTLGPDGIHRLRVIRGGASMLGRMVHDLGGARVVLTQTAEVERTGEDQGDATAESGPAATVEVVATEANFQPTQPVEPAVEPLAPVAPVPAPEPAGIYLDVAALVESVAVDLIVSGAERGILVDMAIEPDLIHPSARADSIESALRKYGRVAMETLSPGASIVIAARRVPGAIQIRAEGGASPFEISLPLPAGDALPQAV